MIIEDCFYNEEKMSKNTIEIDKYLDFILVTLTNNVSLSIAEATLSKSLKTIQNLIPVLTEPKDQKMLHNLLFHRLF
jgi:septin family protein